MEKYWLLMERGPNAFDKGKVRTHCIGIYTSRARAATALRDYYEREKKSEFSDLEKAQSAIISSSHITAWSGHYIHPTYRYELWITWEFVNRKWKGGPLYERATPVELKEYQEKEVWKHRCCRITDDGDLIPVSEWEENEKQKTTLDKVN